MSYSHQPAPGPKRFKKAPLIGLAVLLVMAVSFFFFLSGPKVIDTFQGNAFTGKATVLSAKTKGKKCYLEIKREDGIQERRASGYRNDCVKYKPGQQLDYVKGIIQD